MILYRLRVYIESKRGSRGLLWNFLVLLKDILGKFRVGLYNYYFYNFYMLLHPLSKRALLLKASQREAELSKLLDVLSKKRVRNIIEIGTHRGGTLYAWSRIASRNATIIAIDSCFRENFGCNKGAEAIKILSRRKRAKQKLYFIEGDSHDIKIKERVVGLLRGELIDFLFIDGDHSYDGVKCDFEFYYNLVRNGGIVALHDIVPGAPESVGDVPIFWNEIKENLGCQYKEFVNDWKQTGFGIGVIFK